MNITNVIYQKFRNKRSSKPYLIVRIVDDSLYTIVISNGKSSLDAMLFKNNNEWIDDKSKVNNSILEFMDSIVSYIEDHLGMSISEYSYYNINEEFLDKPVHIFFNYIS